MSNRTISIKPIPKHITQYQLTQTFKQFHVTRADIQISTATAFIQFANPSDVESIDIKFPEGKVDSLGNAEISQVEKDFVWERIFDCNANFSVNKECLVILKDCENMEGISEQKIRGVFKQFGIGKIVKVFQRKQIILEFLSKEDLELLDMNFENYQVPNFGKNAKIDPEKEVEANEFVRLYNEAHFKDKTGKIENPINNKKQIAVKRENVVEIQEKSENQQQNRKKEDIKGENVQSLSKREAEDNQKKLKLELTEKNKKQEIENKLKQIKERKQRLQRQTQEKLKNQNQERKRKQSEQRLWHQKIEKDRREGEQKLRRQKQEKQRLQQQQRQIKLAEQNLIMEGYQKRQRDQLNKLILQDDLKKPVQAKAAATRQLQKYRQNLRKQQQADERMRKQVETLQKQEIQNGRKLYELKLKKQREQRQLAEKRQRQLEEQNKHVLLRKVADQQLVRLIEQQNKQKLAKEVIPLVKHESSPIKKQIHLPFINSNINQLKQVQAPQESTMTKQSLSQSDIRIQQKYQGQAINYSSRLPLRYLTLVLACWLYYIIMH